MWLLLSGNLLKWRLCQAEKIFHPLGEEMAAHKAPQMKRHELCHILFSSLICSTKSCSFHYSPLDTTSGVNKHGVTERRVQRKSCVNYGRFFRIHHQRKSTGKWSFGLITATLGPPAQKNVCHSWTFYAIFGEEEHRSKICACQKCQFTLIKEQPQVVVCNHAAVILVPKSGILEMMVKMLHWMTLHKPFYFLVPQSCHL